MNVMGMLSQLLSYPRMMGGQPPSLRESFPIDTILPQKENFPINTPFPMRESFPNQNMLPLKESFSSEVIPSMLESFPREMQKSERATTKSEVKAELQPLYEEASKYKSAKEFVSNKIFSIEENPKVAPAIKTKEGKIYTGIDHGDILVRLYDEGIIPEQDLKKSEAISGWKIKGTKDFLDEKYLLVKQGEKQPSILEGYKSQLTDIWNKAQGIAKPKVTPTGEMEGEGIPTKEFGFTEQGLFEKVVNVPLEDIPKRSITNPEYRDNDVVATAGKKVKKPIIATVENIDDPNSPIEIIDGWHRWRQAVANKDKTIPVKFIYKPTQEINTRDDPLQRAIEEGLKIEERDNQNNKSD